MLHSSSNFQYMTPIIRKTAKKKKQGTAERVPNGATTPKNTDSQAKAL
jgi:hypothetical protein